MTGESAPAATIDATTAAGVAPSPQKPGNALSPTETPPEVYRLCSVCQTFQSRTVRSLPTRCEKCAETEAP
jgi:hypothetical protein